MAGRRYTRDNRGRFASVGATARGGRLATASGNKRATQTERLGGGKPAGTIGAKAPSTGTLQKRASRGDRAAMGRLNARRAAGLIGTESGFGPKRDTPPLRVDGSVRQRRQIKRSAAANKIGGGRAAGTVGKPRGLKPGSIKPKAAASKPGTSLDAIARRRARAGAERDRIAGGEFNMKLNTRSAIVRSAANEIYNRQRTVAKLSGGSIARDVARSGIGAVQGLSGSKRDRASQLQERARRRVVKGRK